MTLTEAIQQYGVAGAALRLGVSRETMSNLNNGRPVATRTMRAIEARLATLTGQAFDAVPAVDDIPIGSTWEWEHEGRTYRMRVERYASPKFSGYVKVMGRDPRKTRYVPVTRSVKLLREQSRRIG